MQWDLEALERWQPTEGLIGRKGLQHAVASTDIRLTEKHKHSPILLGAGRHWSALCSPLQQPSCSPGATATPFSVCLHLSRVFASCMVLELAAEAEGSTNIRWFNPPAESSAL